MNKKKKWWNDEHFMRIWEWGSEEVRKEKNDINFSFFLIFKTACDPRQSCKRGKENEEFEVSTWGEKFLYILRMNGSLRKNDEVWGKNFHNSSEIENWCDRQNYLKKLHGKLLAKVSRAFKKAH